MPLSAQWHAILKLDQVKLWEGVFSESSGEDNCEKPLLKERQAPLRARRVYHFVSAEPIPCQIALPWRCTDQQVHCICKRTSKGLESLDTVSTGRCVPWGMKWGMKCARAPRRSLVPSSIRRVEETALASD